MFKKKVRRSREFRKNNQMTDIKKAREVRKEKREAHINNMQVKKHTKKQEPSKRKTNQKNRTRNLYTAIIIIIIAVIGFSVFNIVSVHSQYEQAIAERQRLEKEKEKLTYELQNVDSREYVEQQARMMLKMIKPGEIYYIVPEETE